MYGFLPGRGVLGGAARQRIGDTRLDKVGRRPISTIVVIRFVIRFFVVLLFAFLGATWGNFFALSCIPVVLAGQDRQAERAAFSAGTEGAEASSDPQEESGATESLEEPSEDESAGVVLALSVGEPSCVVAASCERAPVVALIHAAPPSVHRETPTRPPRG